MRTLLVDNYDSYTYNLFQLIARVQADEPVVIRNDESVDIDLTEFDNVVVSPGPGDPRNGRDFGISARILAEATIPVLGVCLGHQGIGVVEQAELGLAPAARHGYLDHIRHSGRGLFRSIPQDFTAVRYHSLAVREPLPPALEAIAWAADGVLMGLRHRTRPLWGVQFHPESILTEHGERLLTNFRDLTRKHRRTGRLLSLGWSSRTAAAPPAAKQPAAKQPAAKQPSGTLPVGKPPTVRPSVRRQPAAALENGLTDRGYRLHKQIIPMEVDAEAAFAQRFAAARHAFWLDSSRVGPGEARFSYFGDGTGPLAEFVRYDVQAAAVQIDRHGQLSSLIAGNAFDYLQRELARRRVDDPSLPFDFTGGYVGYFGYEMKAECGAVNRHRAATPDASWLFADRLVVVDHQEHVTYVLCLAEDTPAASAEAATWLKRTAGFLRTVPAPARPAAPPVPGTSYADVTDVEPWLVRDRAQYLADVAACQSLLTAGESYEICLTNGAWLPAPDDPFEYYRALRAINPAPYAAFLEFDGVAVASASPERFLKITRDGVVETKPIKGTAPRSADPAEDARLRDSLAADAKTRAENLMIVDLLRNDLGRVCDVGTVSVPSLMATESYATVHQLVSTVRGQLRAGVDALDAVRACFPGGSMTGAPKLRTLEIIDSLETEARGVYSGAIGFLSCNGTADLNIVIRTAVFVGDRMHLGAGGAIVLDSDPAAEYDEMLLKLVGQMRAYGMPGREAVEPGTAARGQR
ncbi:aminodeoxychorismate synthase component I [Actinoplanes sp. ATCC 53533]|uniref:aminodeoxychorismate synthase component I n=1 Tax=Actinoplanes sp. ATCC 53533 TaxID=1288362 RepID=UPI000F79FF9B|nr:aminodeoxychorismate synthase component I [Actinoplanes sp. ATCC 53533]RSM47541.1 aminodeoxychorismate synthase component I [Actinoplanes sp. ATCC 53533]